MIQRIQTAYFLVAATLVFWVGFGSSLVESTLTSKTTENKIHFNLNGFGWQATTNSTISSVAKAQIKTQSKINQFKLSESNNVILLKQNYPVYITFCVIGLCLIAVIFMFKDLKKQLRLAKIALFILILTVLSIVLFYIIAPSGIVHYCNEIFQSSWQVKNTFGFEFYLLCASICFVFLGITSIRKDQKLVQSLDRIR